MDGINRLRPTHQILTPWPSHQRRKGPCHRTPQGARHRAPFRVVRARVTAATIARVKQKGLVVQLGRGPYELRAHGL